MRYLNRLVALFPFWAILGTALALLKPGLLTPLASWIVPLLGLVMFGMGLTLHARDFLEVARRPGLIAAGSGLQFGVMPLAAWVVGHLLGLSPELLTGLVLVGACPGGTASNVIAYLARGDVALSIALTSVSTFLSVFATPALTWLYVGELVPVPVVPMLQSILTIVIVPVVAGVVVNHFLEAKLDPLRNVFPLVSAASIVLIIAIIVALQAGQMSELAGTVVLAVMLHNGMGLAAGHCVRPSDRVTVYGQRRSGGSGLARRVGMEGLIKGHNNFRP